MNTVESKRSLTNELQIREFQNGDQDGILALLKLTFEHDTLPEAFEQSHWRWKYFGSTNESRIFVITNGKSIVGHYGFIPRFLHSPKGLVKTMVAVDAAIHPDYRQKGLFYNLSLYALDRLSKDNIPFCIGFTAASRANQVMPGHRKAGWYSPFSILVRGRPLNAGAVAEAKFGKGFKSRIAKFALKLLLKTIYRWKPNLETSPSIIEIKEFSYFQ